MRNSSPLIGFSLPVLAAVVLLLTTAAPVRAQSVATSSQNNWTWSGSPTTNYPNATDGNLINNVTRAHAMFTTIDGSVESAIMWFHIYDYWSANNIDVFAQNAYDHSTISWVSQPALLYTVGVAPISATGWYSVDVTDAVNDGRFSFAFASQSGGSRISLQPLGLSPYIEYVPAPGTKPAPPIHCYDFDDTQDIAGTADFVLSNGGTAGQLAGVVNSSLAITSTAATIATFPPLATTAANGFTVSGWWQMNDAFDVYELVTDDGNFRFLVEGGTQTAAASPAGNVVWDGNTGVAGQWNYMGGGISADGAGHVMVDTSYYTDTISPPASTVSPASLSVPDGGRVDQLMIFNYALSRQEHLYLWNGGRGLPCYALLEPTQITTYTITIPMPTPAYTITLPSGAQGDVFLSATSGELMIATSLLFLVAVTAIALFANYGREVTRGSGK